MIEKFGIDVAYTQTDKQKLLNFATVILNLNGALKDKEEFTKYVEESEESKEKFAEFKKLVDLLTEIVSL